MYREEETKKKTRRAMSRKKWYQLQQFAAFHLTFIFSQYFVEKFSWVVFVLHVLGKCDRLKFKVAQ